MIAVEATLQEIVLHGAQSLKACEHVQGASMQPRVRGQLSDIVSAFVSLIATLSTLVDVIVALTLITLITLIVILVTLVTLVILTTILIEIIALITVPLSFSSKPPWFSMETS